MLRNIPISELPLLPETLHNYWDTPEVITSFGYSKRSSQLFCLDFVDDFIDAIWYLRLEKTQASLISWQGTVSEYVWKLGLLHLKRFGIAKVKILGGDNKPFLKQSKETVWWASEWSVESIQSSNFRWKTRSALTTMNFSEISCDSNSTETLIPIFNRWVEGSKKRHFMVTTGHYLKMIEQHSRFHNSRIFLASYQHEPIGFVGGYVYPEQNFGVITLVKHDFSYQKAGRGLWAYCIQEFRKLGCNNINCGDTVDSFKRTLNFVPETTYRSSYERIEDWLKL